MSEKDDQDWFDLVAGRNVPSADPTTRREAALFRQSLLAARVESDALAPLEEQGNQDAAEDRLFDRARREGLIGVRRPVPTPTVWPVADATSFFRRIFGWRGMLAFAAMLAVAVGIVLMPPVQHDSGDDTATFRGGTPELVVAEVPTPGAAARSLADALRSEGLTVSVRQVRDVWYLETTLPDGPPAALVKAFENSGVVGVKAGRLRVLFRAAG